MTIKRLLVAGLSIGMILMVMLASCAPVVTDAPTPTPKAPVIDTSTSVASVNPQEAAWARIVEAAKKEGTLTVYSYWWVGDQATTIAKAFRQRYGIDVQIITGKGAEFIERLKTEKRIGKITADVFEGSATHSQNTKDNGLLGPIADLPILQEKTGWNMQPLIFDPTAHIILHRPWIMVPFINTNLVKPDDAPKTWTDILNPKWKGKMIVPDPRVTNLTYYFVLSITHGDVPPDFIQRLAQQDLRFVRDSSDAVRALAKGEAYLLPNATDSNVAPFAQEGAPVKAVEVDKGTIVSGGVINWVKDGPHPNAAKLFINWLMSDEGQKVEADMAGTLPMRQAVPDSRHPSIRVRVNQPLVIGVQENEEIAKAFLDKVIVDTLIKGK
ncbi:MAG: extracellular solute-binding protein [Dehalococcoidia bacterium]|nr:extracellular solute-binding protein [Dehalococcoidia bacterium]